MVHVRFDMELFDERALPENDLNIYSAISFLKLIYIVFSSRIFVFIVEYSLFIKVQLKSSVRFQNQQFSDFV